MAIFDIFSRRSLDSKTLPRTYEINDVFYDKLKYLSDYVYAASVSQLICASVQHLIQSGKINVYEATEEEFPIKHSFSMPGYLAKELYSFKNRFPSISIGRIINIAIHDALLEQEENLKGYHEQKNV